MQENSKGLESHRVPSNKAFINPEVGAEIPPAGDISSINYWWHTGGLFSWGPFHSCNGVRGPSSRRRDLSRKSPLYWITLPHPLFRPGGRWMSRSVEERDNYVCSGRGGPKSARGQLLDCSRSVPEREEQKIIKSSNLLRQCLKRIYRKVRSRSSRLPDPRSCRMYFTSRISV